MLTPFSQPIALLGFSETSVRLTSAFWGVVGVLAVFLLGQELKNKTLGLWSAFILAIEPWAIHYSRTGFELTTYATFYTLSWFAWLRSLKKPQWFLLWGIFSGLSFYTSNPAWF